MISWIRSKYRRWREHRLIMEVVSMLDEDEKNIIMGDINFALKHQQEELDYLPSPRTEPETFKVKVSRDE